MCLMEDLYTPSGSTAAERFMRDGSFPQVSPPGSQATSQVPEVAHLEFTPEQARKLWRKIDLRLMPIMSLMYFFSFMDRGNAKLEGMVTQLDLTGDRYNVALVTRNFSGSIPSRFIWGLIMTLMGFVRTYQQLAAARFLLGLAEAGFYPGIAYYLTMWYPKYKLNYRFSLFLGMASVAGALSGLLAYGIGFMNDLGGLQGWSWIFASLILLIPCFCVNLMGQIIEGLATVVICCIGAIVFVDYPGTAKFLSAEERQYVEQERLRDVQDAEEGTIVHHLWMTITDWQVWALAIILLSFGIPGYGIAFFLPFGYSTPVSQLLTVPIYVAAAMSTLVVAHFSDKKKLRSPFIMVLQLMALVGYIIELSNASTGIKYFGLFLCAIGLSASPSVISWLANNLEGKHKRALGLAFQTSIAAVSGIIASNIYRAKDEPRYIFGHAISMGFLVVGFLTTLSTALLYRRINLERHALVEGEKGDGDARRRLPLRTL
ncbi:major facilitator superfamily domain-containing protein [Scleroderma yunnanense]